MLPVNASRAPTANAVGWVKPYYATTAQNSQKTRLRRDFRQSCGIMWLSKEVISSGGKHDVPNLPTWSGASASRRTSLCDKVPAAAVGDAERSSVHVSGVDNSGAG